MTNIKWVPLRVTSTASVSYTTAKSLPNSSSLRGSAPICRVCRQPCNATIETHIVPTESVQKWVDRKSKAGVSFIRLSVYPETRHTEFAVWDGKSYGVNGEGLYCCSLCARLDATKGGQKP